MARLSLTRWSHREIGYSLHLVKHLMSLRFWHLELVLVGKENDKQHLEEEIAVSIQKDP